MSGLRAGSLTKQDTVSIGDSKSGRYQSMAGGSQDTEEQAARRPLFAKVAGQRGLWDYRHRGGLGSVHSLHGGNEENAERRGVSAVRRTVNQSSGGQDSG